MLRVIVVDDELPARQGMRQLLSEHTTVEVVGEASTPQQAVTLIRNHRPDAVFLDIEMHSASGFDILEQLPDPPAIVFVTAHSQYAIQAYDVAAVDYLLKPVRPQRLAETIERLNTRHITAPTVSAAPSLLRIKAGGRTIAINTTSLVLLRADKDYTAIFWDGGSPLLASQSLGQLAIRLSYPPFLKLNRSLIININRLKQVERVGRGQSLLRFDGHSEEFAIGRTAADRLTLFQQKGALD
ncbi:MAG: response regulator transcription factor [Proteobacteria bacterium]|nr:response regulator transcription factor [Pseudomonadota bacterium]